MVGHTIFVALGDGHRVITHPFTRAGRFRHIRVPGDRESGGQLHDPGTRLGGLVAPHAAPGLPHTTTVAATHPRPVPLLAMDFNVGVPAILACEGTVAHRARERTLMGMSTEVGDQLVAFGERVVVPARAPLPQAGVLGTTTRDVAVKEVGGESGDGGEWDGNVATVPSAWEYLAGGGGVGTGRGRVRGGGGHGMTGGSGPRHG